MHALITKTSAQSVTTKQHHTEEFAQQTHMTFAIALIVLYHQKFVICHRV